MTIANEVTVVYTDDVVGVFEYVFNVVLYPNYLMLIDGIGNKKIIPFGNIYTCDITSDITVNCILN